MTRAVGAQRRHRTNPPRLAHPRLLTRRTRVVVGDNAGAIAGRSIGLVIHRLESECLLRWPSNTLKISQFDPVIR